MVKKSPFEYTFFSMYGPNAEDVFLLSNSFRLSKIFTYFLTLHFETSQLLRLQVKVSRFLEYIPLNKFWYRDCDSIPFSEDENVISVSEKSPFIRYTGGQIFNRIW